MAEACERYWAAVVRPGKLSHGRDRMAIALEDLYTRRLRLQDGRERARRLKELLEDSTSTLIEIAHDGQVPHLGIIRMVLKSRQLAESTPRGLALYLIGDHYSAEMRPRNLYLGLPLRGVDADHVKTPFTVPVGKHMRHVPFRWLPPPEESKLDELERRAAAWVAHNASYSHKPVALPMVKERLHTQFELLRDSAVLTSSFADWILRVQILWFDAMFGGPPSRLVVLPMSGIVEWLPEILRDVAASGPVASVDRGESVSASSEAMLGREEDSAFGSFWIYCRTCFRRYRATWEEGQFRAYCTSCDASLVARWPGDAEWVMPDIVAYEMALFHAGVAGWVVGSRAAYLPVIGRGYLERFQREMPPTFLLDSKPRFQGLGEPAEGDTRARLLRVLLEVDAADIRTSLEAPWSECPDLRSPLLDGAFGGATARRSAWPFVL